jgi:hypothetical protein
MRYHFFLGSLKLNLQFSLPNTSVILGVLAGQIRRAKDKESSKRKTHIEIRKMTIYIYQIC